MSKTTDEHKEVAKLIAKEITEQIKNIGGEECIVDDWGRFGNFSLLCCLTVDKKHGRGYFPIERNHFSLVKIVNVIKRVISKYNHKGAIKRSHECPQMIYSQQRIRNFTKSYFEGYEKSYIQIDLDFIPYHQESNTFDFPKQKTEVQLKMF